MDVEKVKLPQEPIPLRIPLELLREFKEEPRFILPGGTKGIIVLPDNILRNFELLSKLRNNYDVVLVLKVQEVKEG